MSILKLKIDKIMKFTTPVEIDYKKYPKLTHSHKIISLGSCFSEHIGNKMVQSKLNCLVNPFGVLYNPESILKALKEIQSNKIYSNDDLFYHNDEWHLATNGTADAFKAEATTKKSYGDLFVEALHGQQFAQEYCIWSCCF